MPGKILRRQNNEPVKTPTKVGFIYSGPVSDLGWNYYHDRGCMYLQDKMVGQIETITAENVPENSDVERLMEKMFARGVRIIFATSYGYLEPALHVAQKHPDLTILQCSERANPHPIRNLSTYFPNYYETVYVLGTIAGQKTNKNKIGYIAAHPIPGVLLALNAFTLGARSVNPKLKVHVVWTNHWYDPPTDSEAARGLINQGADVLVADTASALSVAKIAEKENVSFLAYNADFNEIVPKSWLTGMKFNWGPLYVRIVESVLNNTWRASDYHYGTEYGYTKLSTFGISVAPKLREQALEKLDKIKAGKVFVFKGPIKDREGRVIIPTGKVADDAFLAKTDWLVPGIEGNIPKTR